MKSSPNPIPLAYISFDVVPSAKGASTHIEAFTRILAGKFGKIQLMTISPTSEILFHPQDDRNIQHIAFPAVGKTLIHRVMSFRKHLKWYLEDQYFDMIHIRSIYEGFPLAINKNKYCNKLIFEVNGMPSIELKYRYPDIANDRELMQKLLFQEKFCLEQADGIITPSSVTRQYLISRQVNKDKIKVIPNGVDLSLFNVNSSYSSSQSPLNLLKILYFGTLSRWQGVDLAVRAIALCQVDFPVQFDVIGTATKSQLKAFYKLVNKLHLHQSVIYSPPLSQRELSQKMQTFDLILAPLTLNDRNLRQGCCPLKILEGMAAGIPVITSDLPVVRDLGKDRQHFYLVKPNSVQAIADAIITLRDNPNLRKQISIEAKKQIQKYYTWTQAGEALISFYSSLLPSF